MRSVVMWRLDHIKNASKSLPDTTFKYILLSLRYVIDIVVNGTVNDGISQSRAIGTERTLSPTILSKTGRDDLPDLRNGVAA